MPALAAALVMALLTQPLGAQQASSQRFRAGIDLVTVDVVVLDRNGNAVQGLTKADFSVIEEGKPQAITEFEAVSVASPVAAAADGPAPAAPASAPAVSTNVDAPIPAGRSFAIVFDDVNLTRQQGDASRRAIRSFVDAAASPDDTITLVATSGGAWLNARLPRDREDLLSVLGHLEGKYVPDTSAERMSDYEALRIHVFNDTIVEARVRRRYENYRVAGLEPKDPLRRDDMPKIGETRGDVGIVAPLIQSRAEAVYSDAVGRSRLTLELLTRAVDALKPARGRKSVILLSKGFVMDTELRGFKDVARAARDANVAIYFVDARGLEATTSQFTAEAIGPTDERDLFQAQAGIALEAAGAVAVAEDSGGFAVHDTNDLSAGVRRIADAASHYYLVGYVSPNNRRDGAFRRIQVKVNRPGVTIRARKGYYAPDDRTAITRAGLDPDVQRALDAPRDTAGVPLRATAFVFDAAGSGTANVMIGAEADITAFAFEPGAAAGGRLIDVLELAMAATNRTTGAVYRFGQTIDMNVLPETLKTLEKTWYPVSRAFQLPPGPYEARVVVRDRNSGRVGSVTHGFVVPPVAGFRVSTPILSDSVEANAAAGSAKPVLLARRTFESGSTLFVQFAVYGAGRDQATRQPRVTSSWRLLRSDGTLVRETPPRPIAPGADAGLIRLYGVSLGGLAPGEYSLAVDVRDELAVRAVQLEAPFLVVPPTGVSPTAAR